VVVPSGSGEIASPPVRPVGLVWFAIGWDVRDEDGEAGTDHVAAGRDLWGAASRHGSARSKASSSFDQLAAYGYSA
jgi:hypothetical protein